MRLFIPELGTRLLLCAPWQANIRWERRNMDFIDKFFSEQAKKYQELESVASSFWRRSWGDLLKEYAGVDLPDSRHGRAIFSYMDDPANKATLNMVKEKSEKDKSEAYQRFSDYQKANPLIMDFKAGTILEVDRIYIRKGNEDFSSITFRALIGKTKPRFWVRLDEANQIEFENEGKEIKWPEGRFCIFRSKLRSGDEVQALTFADNKKANQGLRYYNIGFTNRKWENRSQSVSDPHWLKGIFKATYSSTCGSCTQYASLEKFLAGTERLIISKELVAKFLEEYAAYKSEHP